MSVIEKDNDWIFYFSLWERAQRVSEPHLSSCSLRSDYRAPRPDYLINSERHLWWTAVATYSREIHKHAAPTANELKGTLGLNVDGCCSPVCIFNVALNCWTFHGNHVNLPLASVTLHHSETSLCQITSFTLSWQLACRFVYPTCSRI